MEKNMGMVSRFEDEMQRKIFLRQCMDNASVLIAGSFAGGDVKLVTAKSVFDYAEALFDEAIKRDYLNYGKGEFMLVISEMDYNKQKIELCVPYGNFVRRLKELPMENQRWIVQGKAVITIMKSYIHDCWGMKIIKVEYNQS